MGFLTRIKKTLVFLATAFLAYFLLLPVLCFILGINELIRVILKIYLRCWSSSRCDLISNGVETFFPTHPAARGGMILGILVVPSSTSNTNQVNLEQELTHFETAVLQKIGPDGAKVYERLEKCLDTNWGYCCRRRGNFHIANHVKIWTETGPSNGEFYTEMEFLEGIIPKLSEHMDYSSKPGWEWVIIPKVRWELQNETDLCTIRVFRCHHSYMDGLSAGLLITECLMHFPKAGKDNRPPFILDPKAKLPREMKNQMLFAKVRGLLTLPFYLMQGLLMNRMIIQDPIYVGESAPGLKHFGVSKKLNLNLVRELRTKLRAQKGSESIGTTDLLATIVISAVTKSLAESGKLTENTVLGFVAPTSAIVPYKDSRPRNRVLWHMLYLRLRKPAEDSELIVDVAKNGQYSFPARYSQLALGRFPQTVFQRVLPRIVLKLPRSTVFTNVPGLKNEGYLQFGGLVTDIGGWSLISKRIGISVVALSYGDDIRFWCVVDDSVMNRVEFDGFLELLVTQKL